MHKKISKFNYFLKKRNIFNFLVLIFIFIFILTIISGCKKNDIDLDKPNSSDSKIINSSQSSQEQISENPEEVYASESSNSVSEKNEIKTENSIIEEDNYQEDLDESSIIGNDPDLSSTVSGNPAYKQQKTVPQITFEIIEGPVMLEDDSISYWRIKAESKGYPTPSLKFSIDDSMGAWGVNISQINVLIEETVELLITASNETGEERLKLLFTKDQFTQIEKTTKIYSEELIASNYFIDVSLQEQKVRVFFKDDLLKEMICSGGAENTPTPTGKFKTSQKIYYAWLPKYEVGAYYYVRFFNSYLFHSTPFDAEGNIIEEEYEKLGQPASHGCIRLDVPDAQWFYESIPLGVIVEIH